MTTTSVIVSVDDDTPIYATPTHDHVNLGFYVTVIPHTAKAAANAARAFADIALRLEAAEQTEQLAAVTL